jgi:hypothetical protein
MDAGVNSHLNSGLNSPLPAGVNWRCEFRAPYKGGADNSLPFTAQISSEDFFRGEGRMTKRKKLKGVRHLPQRRGSR